MQCLFVYTNLYGYREMRNSIKYVVSVFAFSNGY